MLKKLISSIVSRQISEYNEKRASYRLQLENRITELEFCIKNPQKYKRGDLIGKNVVTGVTTIAKPFSFVLQPDTHAWMYTILNTEDGSLSVLSEREVTELVKKSKK